MSNNENQSSDTNTEGKKSPEVEYTENFLKDFCDKVENEERFSDDSKESLLDAADAVKPGDKKACHKLQETWGVHMKADIEAADVAAREEHAKAEEHSKSREEKKPDTPKPKKRGLNLAKDNAHQEEAGKNTGDTTPCYRDSKTAKAEHDKKQKRKSNSKE